MADPDRPFFYSARSVGINKVVLCLADYPDLDWMGRQAVLIAQTEQETLRLYEMDLLWMLVKEKYTGDFPQPSKAIKHGYKKKPLQSAEEIKQYILNRLAS